MVPLRESIKVWYFKAQFIGTPIKGSTFWILPGVWVIAYRGSESWCHVFPDPREDPKSRSLNGGSYKVPLISSIGPQIRGSTF